MSDALLPPSALPPLVHYEVLFRHLPALPPRANRGGPGRPAVSPDALLRAHIYRALRRMPRLGDLVFELRNNPSILPPLGFDPLRPVPSLERFSAFLHDLAPAALQSLHHQLVQMLLAEGAIAGSILAIDSCPIPAPVRENNLKSGTRRNRFDKTRPPRGDPEAGLGILVHYPTPTEKRVAWFWGYRNHIVSDAQSEIPLVEATWPANVSEVGQAVGLLKQVGQTYGLSVEAVLGDAEYDVESILKSIVNDLHAKPYVPANVRRRQTDTYRIVKDQVLCAADLAMAHKGRMTVKGITYVQYVCPLHYRRKDRERYLFCPAQHPKFVAQKGCNALIRQTPTVRSQIPYGSEEFRRYYRRRLAVERVFSRLLALAMQQPTVRGLQAIRNYCTIAHVTTCLVALTAHREGHPDKLRFVRSFVPNFLSEK